MLLSAFGNEIVELSLQRHDAGLPVNVWFQIIYGLYYTSGVGGGGTGQFGSVCKYSPTNHA